MNSGPTRSGRIEVRTLDSPSAVETLVPEWRALEAATPEATGFQAPSWRFCLPPETHARLLAVREEGRLVMLFPLQAAKTYGVTIARWLGEPLAQYGDALALPGPGRAAWRDAALAEMARWRDVDLIALNRLRADGVLALSGLRLAAPAAARVEAPFVDLRAPPAPRKRSMERRLRKLQKIGPLRLEAAADAGARREAAAQALAFKRAWLSRRRRFSAGLSAPGADESLLILAERGALVAHRLWAGDQLASVEIGLRCGAAYRSLIGAYNPELADAAPGHALTLKLVEQLAAEGLSHFDFLAPGDAYKYEFAHGAVALGAHFRPQSLRGALAGFVLQRLRPLAKEATYRLLDRLPPPRQATPKPKDTLACRKTVRSV